LQPKVSYFVWDLLTINELRYGKTMQYTNNQLNDLDIGGICYLLIEKNKTKASITNIMTILYKWWDWHIIEDYAKNCLLQDIMVMLIHFDKWWKNIFTCCLNTVRKKILIKTKRISSHSFQIEKNKTKASITNIMTILYKWWDWHIIEDYAK
jgi:hypothetical protein